jgi:hypothetical protein
LVFTIFNYILKIINSVVIRSQQFNLKRFKRIAKI